MNEPKLQDEIEANKAAPDEAKAKPKKEKPPKRGENPEEIAKLLKDIEKAEKEVQVAEIELDSRKEAAKAAKAEWLVKVSALRECVRTRERWNEESKRQPLLNQKHDKPDNRMKLPYDAKETKSIGILSDIKQSNGLLLTGQGDRHTGYVDADGHMFLVIDGNRFEPDPDDYAILEESTPAASNGEWRQLAIDNLAGEVTVKDLDKLSSAGISTLGDLQDRMVKEGTWWAKSIKGVGEASQTRIEDAFNTFVTANS